MFVRWQTVLLSQAPLALVPLAQKLTMEVALALAQTLAQQVALEVAQALAPELELHVALAWSLLAPRQMALAQASRMRQVSCFICNPT